MRVEYINPFLAGASSVLEMVLGETPVRQGLSVQSQTFTSEQCNIVCGVTGQAQGQVIYGMSLMTADKIASHMLGKSIKTFDALAASAIAELGNMISGCAMGQLSEAGYICDITPPAIIRGSKVEISTLNIPAVIIKMETNLGPLSITVSLQGHK